jgi:hypothetical protein
MIEIDDMSKVILIIERLKENKNPNLTDLRGIFIAFKREQMSQQICGVFDPFESNKHIDYYCIEHILFDSINHIGSIKISFWRNKIEY